MVKRIVLVLIVLVVVSVPVAAQDFSTLDISFGYGNYGVEDLDTSGTMLTTDRVHGFAMHTTINLASWFGFENFTGAYALNNDVTLVTNTFGAKLIARDLLEGRISPYLAVVLVWVTTPVIRAVAVSARRPQGTAVASTSI